MAINYEETVYRINCLASDLDALYHRAALKLGLADSVMFVLYLICERDGVCPLGHIRKATGMSKQTLNSALRKLEGEGTVYLEHGGGRAKNVCLTEKGRELAERTVFRLFSAECGAFAGWSEQEIDLYLSLMERYNDGFRRQIEIM